MRVRTDGIQIYVSHDAAVQLVISGRFAVSYVNWLKAL